MSTEDELYESIISWLDQREDYASHLRKLAHELESVRKKCNAGRAVGNSVTVVGGLAMIGAGVATFCSAGIASPLLVAAGAYGAIGSTVTITSKTIEMWLESGTLKKAKKISEQNKRVGEKIQRCIEELIEENMDGSEPAIGDDYVVECVLRAIAKRLRIRWNEVVRWVRRTRPVWGPLIARLRESLNETANPNGMEERLRDFLTAQARRVVTEATLETLKRVGKGAVQVGGGVFTVAMTLPDTIDNYKRAIKNNNVTGPSEELKNAAHEIRRTTKNLRAVLDEIENRMRELRN